MPVATTTVRVDFVSESAGYRNTFGWYNRVTGEGGILFAGIEAQGSHPTVVPGSSYAEFDVATADLGDIQFFLIPNGDGISKNSNAELSGPIKVIQLANGSWAVATVDEDGDVETDHHGRPNILYGEDANALFTETSKNAGGVDYASSTVGPNQTAATLAGDTADGLTGLLAWEDLAAKRKHHGTYTKPGDADYNDAVFQISTVANNQAPVAVADTNAGDPVVEAGVDPGNTPFAGDPSATGNVGTNDSDPDGDPLTVTGIAAGNVAGPVSGNVGASVAGIYGALTLAANGTWTYSLANADADTNALARGETAADVFTYTISDGQGGTATATLTVNLTGTNDGPVITGGDTTGAVQEDGTLSAGGTLSANDVDDGATATWSVSGGVSVVPSDYAIGLDQLKITKGGVVVFEDNFGDGAPPPSVFNDAGTPFASTYSVQGSVVEAGGRAIFDYDLGLPTDFFGTADPGVFTGAGLLSNNNPADPVSGLKLATDFQVEARFDLAIPDNRESYGIRLADRQLGGGGNPPDQIGDDVVDLLVRRDGAGVVTLTLREIDFATETSTIIETIPFTPPPGADQIVLRLIHVANAQTVQAAFDYLSAGVVVGTQSFTSSASIFSNEIWTRAQIVTSAPEQVTSVLDTDYGTPTIDQSGNWTYTLANDRTNVQALAEGQTAIDTFMVEVTDEHGASASQEVSVTVTGDNDAPVFQSGSPTQPTSRFITEIADNAPGENTTVRNATGLISFLDRDLIDVHSAAATELGAGYRGVMTASVMTDTTGGHGGYVSWDYAVDDSALDDLAQGQTLVQNYSITVDDGHGGTATRTVRINLTGTNDAPLITAEPGSATDVLGAWAFGGTAIDVSGHGHNLALSGAAGFGTGLFGQALLLDGTQGSYAQEPGNNTAFDFGSSNFAIQIWVKFDDNGTGFIDREQTLIEKFSGNSGGPGLGWTLTAARDGSDQFIQFYADANFSNPAEVDLRSPVMQISTDQWHQVLVTRSGDTYTLYWNGDEVGTTTSSGPLPASPNPLLIGARDAADGRNFTVDGVIDNTVIWSRALSPVEIAQSWNGGVGVEQSFGDSAGTTLAETDAGLTASGTLTASDVDVSDIVTVSVLNAAHTGPTGGLSDAQLLSYFGVTAGPIDTSTTTSGQFTWDFNSGGQAFDFLAVGETLTLHYTIRPDDGHLQTGIGDGVVTITITGTDDAPTVSASAPSATLVEAGITAGWQFATLAAPYANPQAFGINDAGEIVGSANNGTSGFLYSGGVYTTLNNPAATVATIADDINSSGDIVGYYYSGGPNNHAFLYSGGVYTTIDDPLGISSVATGINDADEVVGFYNSGGVNHGFLYSAGIYTTLDHPLGMGGTFAQDVNDLGQIVGNYQDAGGNNHGFLYSGGVFTSIDDPLAGAGPSGNGSFAQGINDAGEIVGYYWDAVGTHGFLYSGGVFTTLDDPLVVYSGFGGTFANGINNSDEIVGRFDSDATYSFIATQDSAGVSTSVVTLTKGDVDGIASYDTTGWTQLTPTTFRMDGTYGFAVLDTAADTLTYTLDNARPATDGLFQGQPATDGFNIVVQGLPGGLTALTPVTFSITGTNDAPVITSGPGTGAVTEDLVPIASGTMAAFDPDNGAQEFWTVIGGTAAEAADYHFVMDNFKVTKNPGPMNPAGSFFEDPFSDGLAPPNSPPFANLTPHSYFVNGSFEETAGKLILDSDNAAPAISVGTPDPFIGTFALVLSNINPAELDRGLKNDDNFTVEGLFDLIIPDDFREVYGIRLNDRHVGGNGTPPDQLGDDLIELVVRKGQDGVVRVQLRELDIVNDQTINIGGVVLAPPPGADQIMLRLTHSTSNVGALVASFDYLAGGTVIGSTTLSAIGRIFGTETPGFTGDDENWTRAQIIAYAPALKDTTLAGAYGSLTISQGGGWTYALANGLTSVQNLAEGQTAIDTFTIQVTDEHGASDTEIINITVTGSNDAPVVVTGPVGRTLAEDSAATLTATGDAFFFDIDLNDTHTIVPSLVSATLSDGSGVPGDVLAAAAGALSTTMLDPATGDTDGQYEWDFALDNGAVDFLASGETLTLVYDVAATDDHGVSDTQTVTITITGVDDAPLAPVQFGPRVSYTIGGHHASVAIGDLNGDNDPDLVVTNAFLGSVSVLMGNGDGTFQPQGDYATGDRPLSVAITDLDGDGGVDLVVANADSDTVSILLGNGDGTFQSQATYGTGQTPASVVIGDFNGDNEYDLAVANQENGNSVSILLGNGDGTFQTQTAYATGLSPNWVASSDLNGDNVLDLVTANGDASGVSVLLGNGDGTFANQVAYAAGSSQSSVAIGDFDGDGNSDLVATNYLAGTVSTLLGNGDGTFQGPTAYAVGELPLSVAVGDLNLDGTLDFVVANSNSDTVSVLLGRGDGTFESQATWDSGLTPYTVAIGDLNGDYSSDLAIASYHYTAAVSILLNAAGAQTAPIERVSVGLSGEANGASGALGSGLPIMFGDNRYVAFYSDATNLVADDTNGKGDFFVYDRALQTTERIPAGINGASDGAILSVSADGRYFAFNSLSSSLVVGDSNATSDIFIYDRQTQSYERIEGSSGAGNGYSSGARISGDGNVVAFHSAASNLVAGDTNGNPDCFIYDRGTATIERVLGVGGAQDNSGAAPTSISYDGRYVAFYSAGTNLVAGDTNGVSDTFIYDRVSGSFERISVASNGDQANGNSDYASISPDGRFVAFASEASNLVAGDTNGVRDIFVHDRLTHTTERVSVTSSGTQLNGASNIPTISDDGSIVAFHSTATNGGSDPNGTEDVFVFDLQTDTLMKLSTTSAGLAGNGQSAMATVSNDGQYVAFDSFASDLVVGDNNGVPDVFLANLALSGWVVA